MNSFTLTPSRRAEVEDELYTGAVRAFGSDRASRLRRAPSWFRGVHNGWPVLLTHASADLIYLFAALIARVPEAKANWQGFIDLAEHADWHDEFLSATVEWTKRSIDLLRYLYEMSLPGPKVSNSQVLMGGFWDDPRFHHRGRMNPRVADEVAAIALSCRGSGDRIQRQTFPLVHAFYSLRWLVPLDSPDSVRMLLDKILRAPRTMDWCVCYPFTASLSGIKLPTVTCEAEQKRMYSVLQQPPPKLIADLRGARFPII